jgi:hypothetical protein
MKRKRKAFRSMQTARIISKSPEETYEFGLKLARSIPVPGVVLLQGALGTGKTTIHRWFPVLNLLWLIFTAEFVLFTMWIYTV